MKTKKLLKRLTTFLNRDQHLAAQELRSLREILHKLKEKEQKYARLFEAEDDPNERAHLATKRDVVHAQRIKGIERVRTLLGKGIEPPAPDE